jgi:ribonuclease E
MEAKLQSERFTQKKHSRPPRDEKSRSELKVPVEEQPANQEGLQGAQQSEEGGRRRRRGGRQRERTERLDRTGREGKPAAAREPHSDKAETEVMDNPSPMPAIISIPAQEASAVAPTPTLLQEGITISKEDISPHAGPLSVEEAVAGIAPAAFEGIPVEPSIVQGVASVREELIEEPSHEITAGLPDSGSEMLLEPAEAEKVEKPEAAETDEADETQQEQSATHAGEHPFITEGQELPAPKPAQVIEPLDLVASGLIMVETIPGKIKPVKLDVAEEPLLQQRRRKRIPPAPAVQQDEPLVQVETHK